MEMIISSLNRRLRLPERLSIIFALTIGAAALAGCAPVSSQQIELTPIVTVEPSSQNERGALQKQPLVIEVLNDLKVLSLKRDTDAPRTTRFIPRDPAGAIKRELVLGLTKLGFDSSAASEQAKRLSVTIVELEASATSKTLYKVAQGSVRLRFSTVSRKTRFSKEYYESKDEVVAWGAEQSTAQRLLNEVVGEVIEVALKDPRLQQALGE